MHTEIYLLNYDQDSELQDQDTEVQDRDRDKDFENGVLRYLRRPKIMSRELQACTKKYNCTNK